MELNIIDLLLPEQDLNKKIGIINLALLLSDQPSTLSESTSLTANAVTTQNGNKTLYTPQNLFNVNINQIKMYLL